MKWKQGVKAVAGTLFCNPLLLKAVLMVALMCTAIPPVHKVIGPYMKLLLGWGVLVGAVDVFTRRRAFRNRYAGFLLAFCASYAVSVFLNRGVGLSSNLSGLLYMLLFMLVVFAYDFEQPPQRAEWEVRLLARLFVGVTFLFACFCLSTFLLSISYRYREQTTPSYFTVVVIGMSENRLYGLYNCNTGSAFNLLSTMFSLLLLTYRKPRFWATVGHVVNILVQYCCLLLTLSRTAFYMYAVFAALFVLFVWPRRAAKSHRVTADLLRAAGAVVAAVLVLALSVPIKTGLSYLPPKVTALLQSGEMNDPGAQTPNDPTSPDDPDASDSTPSGNRVDLNRVEDVSEVGVLTGRTELWRAGWRAFLDHPLFGTTREGLYPAAKDYLREMWHINLQRGGTHNIVVMTLVCSGGVGFLILALFLVLSGGRALRWLWKRRGLPEAVTCNLLIVLLITMLGLEMMESRLLYTANIFGMLFWMMYGYAMHLVDACEPEKAAKSGLYNRLLRKKNA